MITERNYQKIADQARMSLINKSEEIYERIHWGSSFSLMEIVSVLLGEKYNKETDVFLLSKGHGAPGVYAVMHELGELGDSLWDSYGEDGSPLSELMEYNPNHGFYCSGGSLGLAPSYGAGIALLKKHKNEKGRIYTLTGDGEMDEGSVWEAIASIAHYKLDNYTLIIDCNRLQSDGETSSVLKLPEFTKSLEAFGWNTTIVDGHDCDQIFQALSTENKNDIPTAIICNTVKGKGVSFMENQSVWHDRRMTKEEFEIARREVMSRVADE